MTPDVYDIDISEPKLNTYTLFRHAWLAVNRLAENKLSRVGLTAETFTLLWGIRDYSGKISPVELVRLSHRDKQTIDGLLNRMEKMGLISRIRKHRGQPFTKLVITPKGQEMCATALPLFKSFIEEVFSSFSMEQQEQLQKLLRALRDNSLKQLHYEIGLPSGDIVPRSFHIEW
jgi:DNA-binding MarR family transcriptional regulator